MKGKNWSRHAQLIDFRSHAFGPYEHPTPGNGMNLSRSPESLYRTSSDMWDGTAGYPVHHRALRSCSATKRTWRAYLRSTMGGQ